MTVIFTKNHRRIKLALESVKQIIILSTLPEVWRSPDVPELVSSPFCILERKVCDGFGHVAADDAAPPVLVLGVEGRLGEAGGHWEARDQPRARGGDHMVRSDTGGNFISV